jgi:type II secretory ATPase GspE/PulE/Tfp pilus assembly ATPase PilB-like protein
MRLAVMPTSNGLRAVVRLPAELTQPRSLDELHLPPTALDGLKRFAKSNAGMLLLTGPAGSGKTTTIYALLEYMVEHSQGLSIVSLEDPVERDLPGVTQIEVSPFGELTYERALRSMLRQDPQVLALGEIRDDATATVALQAALSGHRMISTLHAGTPGGAVSRLLEMGIEPYQITSAVCGVVAMRLIRAWNEEENRYQGRVPVAEFAVFDGEVRDAILRRADAGTIQSMLSAQDGYVTLRDAAAKIVESGVTKQNEVDRVIG